MSLLSIGLEFLWLLHVSLYFPFKKLYEWNLAVRPWDQDSGIIRILVKSWSQGLTAYNDHDVISCSNLTAMILKYRAKKKGRPLQKHKSSPWNTRYGPFFGHHIMLFQVLADYTKKIPAAHYAFKEFVPETGFFFSFSFWL